MTIHMSAAAAEAIRVVALPGGGPEIELALVPAGPFLMGDVLNRSAERDTRPVHEVELDAYYAGRFAVTNEQFAWFVAQTGYRTTREEQPRAGRDGRPA